MINLTNLSAFWTNKAHLQTSIKAHSHVFAIILALTAGMVATSYTINKLLKNK